jgi:hypothetical protein
MSQPVAILDLDTPRKRSKRDDDVRALLQEQAVRTAEAWADQVRTKLRQEGRILAGGWPGTVSEARARITRALDAEMGAERLLALRPEELELAVRATFTRARQSWLRREEATPDEDEVE